jgi:N-acetylglucosaminyl-diphospho-decaprenol L-rhamnosyltransferase
MADPTASMNLAEQCQKVIADTAASLAEKSEVFETLGDFNGKMGEREKARHFYTMAVFADPLNERLHRKRLSLSVAAAHPKATLSVVLSSYYRFNQLVQTVDNVRKSTLLPHQLIVVVDKCDDGTVEFVREQHGKNNFVGIINDRHMGNVASLIKGMCQTRGDYIALIGDDIQLMPGWDLEAVMTIDGDERAGCAVPLILDAGGQVDSAGHCNAFYSTKFEWIGRLKDAGADYARGKSILDFPELHQPRECDYGVAPVLKRKCLEQIGAVDGAYRHYFFDPDLGFTLQKNGWKNIYCPTSIMVHSQKQSEASERERNQKAAPEYYYFVNKWGLRLP